MSVNIYNATNNELKPIASDSIDASTLADKTDISSIVTSGTTNSTGSTITSGTWFYLNGDLCKAKVDIANGATFTLNTNYEKKSVGSVLTELNSNMAKYFYNNQFTCENPAVFFNVRTIYSRGLYIIECGWWGASKCTGIAITSSDYTRQQVIVENPIDSSVTDTQLMYLKCDNATEHIQVRMNGTGVGNYNLMYLSV